MFPQVQNSLKIKEKSQWSLPRPISPGKYLAEIIVLARLWPRENMCAHHWGDGDTSGYLAMVWMPQCRAGLQHHLGRTWRYIKLWTHRLGHHKTGTALGCRCWCLNQGHGQSDINATSCTEGLELSVGTGTELKSICRWGKGKPVFQAFCKTEPAAPRSTGYNKSVVTASPFPPFKYSQACRIHRIKQGGLWLCSPAVGGDRSALAWLIP